MISSLFSSQAVHPNYIEKREEELTHRAFHRWRHTPDIIVLGNKHIPRLPIFSFLIRHSASDKFLHYNFVATLLNDLFGIQSRGGCACAGPYGHDLLGVSEMKSKRYFELIREDRYAT